MNANTIQPPSNLLSRPQMDRLLKEPNGVSSLFMAVRNNQADMEEALDAIATDQRKLRWKVKRMVWGVAARMFS